MSLFNKLFKSGPPVADAKTKVFTPGRYVDINKKPQQLEAWDTSKKLFEEKKYLDSVYQLCLYLKDPAIENLQVTRNEYSVEFEITQGSKVIKGIATNDAVTAETRIASYQTPSIAFLRKLMNYNFSLQYNRFAVKDNVVYLKFTSKTIDASPNKLYYSLKELALKADKLDDVLINEFPMLEPIDVSHVTMPNNAIVEARYNYMIRWINEDMQRIAALNEDRMSGAISYILLALIFRIDYLLVPQGSILNDIEKINGIYNANDGKTPVERNRQMIEELKKLASRDKEDLKKEFYDIKAVFGYVSATSHKTFHEFVLDQFKNTDWYYNNRYDDVVQSIYEYTIGYSAFSFGMYPATFEMLALLSNVLHNDFFKEMGVTAEYYNKASGKFNVPAIEKETQRIINTHKKDFPKLQMLTNKIQYRNMNEFLYTYLNEMTYLNFSK